MALAGVATAVCSSSPHCAAAAAASSCGKAKVSSNNAKCVIGGYMSSSFTTGQKLRRYVAAFPVPRARGTVVRAEAAEVVDSEPERLRLNNLSPQPGSRKRNKRKGRGIAAGQGASCGFGMRGQKSRSGSTVRPGFEGGQMPLYRRVPKLKGIAGGMGAGLPKFVTVNLGAIEAANFSEGEEVSLESLTAKRILNPSGRDAKLRLKILGDGELSTKLTIKAGSFSKSAREKLEAAGSTLVDVPGRKKWVRPSVLQHQQRAEDYFAQKRASGNWVEK